MLPCLNAAGFLSDCCQDTYLFPLRDTIFEGMPAKIPFRFKELLAAEYGERSLTKTDFHELVYPQREP